MSSPSETVAPYRLAENLDALLKHKKVSMRKLSSLSGVSFASISRMVHKNSRPRDKNLEQIANVFDIPVDTLIYSPDPISELRREGTGDKNAPATSEPKTAISSLFADPISKAKKIPLVHATDLQGWYESGCRAPAGNQEVLSPDPLFDGFAVRIASDDMRPTLSPGDTVYFSRSPNMQASNDLLLGVSRAGEIVLGRKRTDRSGNVYLAQDNQAEFPKAAVQIDSIFAYGFGLFRPL